MKRIDVPEGFLDDYTEGEDFALPDDTAHYVTNVLRLGVDDTIELFDGTGHTVVACITADADDVVVNVREADHNEGNESPLTTRLFQAIPKGKRWKWLLQKATELGVDEVVPLRTEHTVVVIPDDRLDHKMERWEKIVSSAARQSQRPKIPDVHRPHTVDEALEMTGETTGLVAHTDEETATASNLMSRFGEAADAVDIWIGPEGGFTDDEITALSNSGVQAVSLGPRILRSETAGVVAVALAQSQLGDM